MDEMKRFAEEVKARRLAAGLSRESLSSRAHVSVNTIGSIERGVTFRSVHHATRAALEAVLGPLPPTRVGTRGSAKKQFNIHDTSPVAILCTARAEALAEVEAAKAQLAKAEDAVARLDAAIAALGGG